MQRFDRTFTCVPRNADLWASLLVPLPESSDVLSFHQTGASFLALSSEGPWDSEPAPNEEDEDTAATAAADSSSRYQTFSFNNSNVGGIQTLFSSFSMKTVLAFPKSSPAHQSGERRRRRVTKLERTAASKAKVAKSIDNLNTKVRQF